MLSLLSVIMIASTLDTLRAQDTFSIVAVDTVTGEVGSAGASCISNCIIISDVHPGIGAMHTQAQWNGDNQLLGYSMLEDGLTPQQIIDSVHKQDAEGRPAIRQYGVVTLAGPIHAAAYTGDTCLDYKGHIVGANYSIQGNILKGREILQQIETNFLTTSGPLADRLMAALQGAKVPGADTRCLSNGTSSKSSFLRVGKRTDDATALSLDINVPDLPAGVEPIDTLQRAYNRWKAAHAGVAPVLARHGAATVSATADQSAITFHIRGAEQVHSLRLLLINALGRPIDRVTLALTAQGSGEYQASVQREGLASGVYFYRLFAEAEGPVPQSVVLGSGKVVVE